MKKFMTVILLISTASVFAQLNAVTFKELETLQLSNPKPVIIHLYSDWCAVCKIEMQGLNRNKDLVKLMNDTFYFIHFEAEKTREEIIFQGRKFQFLPNGNSGIHELVLALSKNKNQPVYPLWIVLDKNLKLLNYHEGKYAESQLQRDLEKIIN
ncbi:thiol:disulfide interchange protein [Chryseobacterium sp. Leaf180]|uniref:hypothetical protein n=1 Tax=Chryseobacterium sp. Leaf180 TaxID=1736289 RepID=UPI0007004199|nr:hypothetical protein [Chryseobacterium sp. Leaf180]KQR92613.1 thiol:disulfide interchange protein [Chryseobacterium sp. Leaf180]